MRSYVSVWQKRKMFLDVAFMGETDAIFTASVGFGERCKISQPGQR